MEQYVIKGGVPLSGEVEIGGAKNAALAILAAAIMTDETVTIDNLPDVRDINVLLDAIAGIGAKVERIDSHTVKINGSYIDCLCVDYDSMKKIRASYYLLGALLGKYKEAEVALPGGCNIGSRPMDLHIKGFKALGASVELRNGAVAVEAKELVGTHIYLDKVSVGATINVMMAAVMADGKTTIENAAKEPHVVDVANFLNSMGANIRGAGTDVIRIVGVESLHKTDYSVIPDQIEAGTFMFAAAATHGDILVKNVIPKHLEATSAKLLEAGCRIEEFDDAVRVSAAGTLHNTQVTTLPYPGFPTDMQPQMAVVLGIACYFVIPKTDVEYEYLFINGDFDIDMIMSKTKRKKVKSFKLSEADLAAPLDSHRMDYYNGNQNMKVLDFSSGNPEHKRFGVITRLDGNLCKIILEPDEALAQAMKNSAPSKVFLD